MMRCYAAAAGMESNAAKKEGREFDIHNALKLLLKIVNPTTKFDHESIIQKEYAHSKHFYDRPLVEAHLLKKKGVKKDKIHEFLDMIERAIITTDRGYLVRLVIASVIEEQFSPEDRGEYMFEVLVTRRAF
ncbi:MAG: hypothetical protein PHS57_08400 [Alphaproteobacteria bacterium]|nr:hypothetical protein [Alphaproteobacteria bacterium]